MKKALFSLCAMLLMLAPPALASPIGISFTSFGLLPGATFGGSGIPNTDVAITQVDDITLGLTVTPRFDAPAVTNDGAGTFMAQAGANATNPALSLWNIDYYMQATGSYIYELVYDLDPGVSTDESELGRILFLSGTQDSQNLGFGFFGADLPPFIHAPDYGPFDPNASGEYSFGLIAYTLSGQKLGESAIRVQTVGGTTTPVPEPGTLALMGLGLAMTCTVGRRKFAPSRT